MGNKEQVVNKGTSSPYPYREQRSTRWQKRHKDKLRERVRPSPTREFVKKRHQGYGRQPPRYVERSYDVGPLLSPMILYIIGLHKLSPSSI